MMLINIEIYLHLPDFLQDFFSAQQLYLDEFELLVVNFQPIK